MPPTLLERRCLYRSEDERFDVIRGGGTSLSKAKCYHLIDAVSGEHLASFALQQDAMAEAERRGALGT